MSLDYMIQTTVDLKIHLSWWLNDANLLKGRIFKMLEASETTDASLERRGWRGHLNNQTVQGLWPDRMKTEHINKLELEAVLLSVKHFLHMLRTNTVMIRVRQYNMCPIHKQARGDKISQTMSDSMEIENNIKCQKHFGRLIKPLQCQVDRMDSSSNGEASIYGGNL